jgi:cytochrome c oxidase subunit II
MGLVPTSKSIRSALDLLEVGVMRAGALAALSVLALGAPAARAEEAQPWQLGMQPAASVVREHIDVLHDYILLPIITAITLFVLGLLLYTIVKFSAKRHPVPSKVSHHTVIEIAWTVIPIIILVVIAIPSFKLLYFMDRTPDAQMTLKVTGHQWYWSYEYSDQGNLSFDSNMIPEEESAKEGKHRLLDVDNPVVLPVDTNVRILVTGTDVIHSWFVPSFGVQEYAVIGRSNESWVKITREGTYYGQCNQICGVNHPFMPIEVHAVSKADFAKWLDDAKKKFAHDDSGAAAARLAANAAAEIGK